MKTNKILAIISITAFSISGSLSAYGGGQMGGGNASIERPDNWMEMSQEERQSFMQSQGMEDNENRLMNKNRHEEIEDMTEFEREVFQSTRQLKNQRTNTSQNTNKKNQSQNRFTQNVKKANNYKKFTGILKQKKNFSDGSTIKNKEAVDFLQQRGILDGYGDGSFKPKNPINRAESIKVLLESIGETPDEVTTKIFSDVPADSWFSGYVNKAQRQGIIKGYEDGSFKPEKTVNQVELLKVAFESFGIDLTDYPITDLPTEDDMNAWYAPYLQYAIDNNLLDLEIVNPGEGMTREAFSEVIYRLIQQQEAI